MLHAQRYKQFVSAFYKGDDSDDNNYDDDDSGNENDEETTNEEKEEEEEAGSLETGLNTWWASQVIKE